MRHFCDERNVIILCVCQKSIWCTRFEVNETEQRAVFVGAKPTPEAMQIFDCRGFKTAVARH